MTQTRLLTLTGPGGCGKTRLALEIAREVQENYPDDVWLVELGRQADADRIAQAAAFALGFSESPDRPIMERLTDHLASRRPLLVLDNCEHLIDECARFVYTLLTECPHVHILATSREPLHIAGETTFLVPSLALSEWQPGQPATDLLRSEAVELFIERARSIQPGFSLNAENAPSVFQVCRMLDGIPLALELAAARVGILSLNEMAARVNSAFRWLETADRLAPPRQQTLHAALDWSYHLLQPEEQCLFHRLSVFIGGFSLGAAEQVCSGDGIEPEQIMALLVRLVDKSFVACAEKDGQVSRYRMLEVVRQYGLEKLAQSGEERAVRERHFYWCLDFAVQAENGVISADRAWWTAEVENELPNLRQALSWALADRGISEPANRTRTETVHNLPLELAHRLAAPLGQFWQLRGYIREGMAWFEAVLSHSEGVSPSVLALTYHRASFMAVHLWDLDRAQRYAGKALEIWRAEGDQEATASQLCFVAITYVLKNDFAQARKLIDESMAMYERIGPRFGVAVNLMQLGDMNFIEGEYRQAEVFYKEGVAVCVQVGNELGISRRQIRLAQVAIALGELDRAKALLDGIARSNLSTGDRWSVAMILGTAADLARAQGRFAHAARCLGTAHLFVETFGTHLWPIDRMIVENNHRLLLERLGQEAFSNAWEEARQRGATIEQALDFVLDGLADVQPVQGSARVAKQASGGLTSREREIAVLILRGMNNAEIAKTLFIGVRTVEAHITHILSKLNFTSRTQIAVWASNREL